MILEKTFERLLIGKGLSEGLSQDVFERLFQGTLSEPDAKALLLLLAAKGETSEELTGCLKALRRLEPAVDPGIAGLIDTCGTGGDGSGTINVSTLSALVIAGAGGRVAKHGNRAISSRSGSSDLLEALGVRLDCDRELMIAAIRRFGIGYFHAPFYHPVFARVQPLRRALGVRTLFNLLGPLVNPFKLRGQVIGVSRKEHLGLFAAALARSGVTRGLVCHSRDGLDEISGCAVSDAAWIEKGRIRYGSLDPRRYGFKKAKTSDYAGGSPARNRTIALKVLKGRLGGPVFEVLVLNAAAGLWVSGITDHFEAGFKRAEDSLKSGKAHEALKGLVMLSHSSQRAEAGRKK